MENFTVGKIRRSFQRFNDFASDLSSADMNTFDDRLALLMDYCKNDEIFHVIDAQLINVNSVDFDSWYSERMASMGGFLGSGELMFPTDLDLRLSMMYQLVRKITESEIDLIGFTRTFFATNDSRKESRLYAFSNAIIQPLARELSYRFEEVLESLSENQRDLVSLTSVKIFHSKQVANNNVAVESHVSQKDNVEKDDHLDNLFSKLIKQIHEAVEGSDSKKESIEVAESAQTLLDGKSPKPAAAKALLKTLPSSGHINSVVSALITAIDHRFKRSSVGRTSERSVISIASTSVHGR